MTDLAPAPRLDVGRVIGKAFGAISANGLAFFLNTFVLSVMPFILISGVAAAFAAPMIVGLYDGRNPLPLQISFQAINAVSSLAGWAGSGAVLFGALETFKGRRTDVSQCIGAGSRFYLALLALALMVNLAVLVGLVALIVPGFLLATMLIVAGPAAVAERIGVFAAMRRAAALSRGNRWMILVLIVAFSLLNSGLGYASSGISRLVASGMNLSLAMTGIVSAGIGALFITVTLTIRTAGLAALYHELRTLKEDPRDNELAQVFD